LKFQRYHWALDAVGASDGASAIKEVTTALKRCEIKPIMLCYQYRNVCAIYGR
jgi:hypothetical protein